MLYNGSLGAAPQPTVILASQPHLSSSGSRTGSKLVLIYNPMHNTHGLQKTDDMECSSNTSYPRGGNLMNHRAGSTSAHFPDLVDHVGIDMML